jgi:hypothetical protein
MHNALIAVPIIAAVIVVRLMVYRYGQKKRDEGRAGFWTRSIFGSRK